MRGFDFEEDLVGLLHVLDGSLHLPQGAVGIAQVAERGPFAAAVADLF